MSVICCRFINMLEFIFWFLCQQPGSSYLFWQFYLSVILLDFSVCSIALWKWQSASPFLICGRFLRCLVRWHTPPVQCWAEMGMSALALSPVHHTQILIPVLLPTVRQTVKFYLLFCKAFVFLFKKCWMDVFFVFISLIWITLNFWTF